MIWRGACAAVVVWSALCAGMLAVGGCSQAKPAISYAGKELPPLVDAEQVRTFAGGTPPDGHQVIGVITSRCETVNDSSGLLAGRCSHTSMRNAAKAHAAKVGGTGLLDLACSTRQMEREHTRQDAGQSRIDVRHMVLCRATVVRGPVEVAVAAASAASSTASDAAQRTIELAGVTLEVNVTLADGPKRQRPARSAEEVGELSETPANAVTIATIKATCTSGCARNVPHRALRKLAAELGALAIANTNCLLADDRWQCTADALDEGPARPPTVEYLSPAPAAVADAGQADAQAEP